MSENTSSENIEALESFLLDNPEFDKLEEQLNQFNIFETLQIVNAEVRHSNVLAWLLNPAENHGLGTFFLRHILKHFVSENKNALLDNISLFDLERYNFADIEIRREWNNIDLLIIINEDVNKMVIAIENKVLSSEHSNQLERYRKTIEQEFSDYIKLFIYLTPDNLPPSDENWCPFSYSTISILVSNVLKHRGGILNENVKEFISQYNTILRRYIVGNSEIEQICQQIYKKHSKALDLIFQYKPDLELQISEYLQNIIQQTDYVLLDSASKSSIRFTTNIIDKKIDKISEGWVKSNRILLFEFKNYDKKLELRLYIGPGPQQYRDELLKFCQQNPPLFNLSERKYYGVKWHAVFHKKFLTKRDSEDATIEELSGKIEEIWSAFTSKELIKINKHFENFQKNTS